MRVTVLGCGGSSGVPMIGCSCAICTSDDPKNKRSRVSLYIETGDKKLLIDTSPDLRTQSIRSGLKRIDAVIYTHDHADHTHGLDDMRSFNYLANNPIPVYGDAHTIETLQKRFEYAFKPRPEIWFRPCLVPTILPDEDIFEFNALSVQVTGFKQIHGRNKTLGYRIGGFAYSTDLNSLPECSFEALTGLKLWVVDCLRHTPSHAHSHLQQTLEWIARLKPEIAVLTHMGHEFDYETLSSQLPPGVIPGYDGLVLDI